MASSEIRFPAVFSLEGHKFGKCRMRLDAQDRILSLSFERDPKEHAAIMLAAGRRLMQPRRKLPVGVTFVAAVAVGAVIGLSMEFYRRLVLEPLFGIDQVAPFNIVALQILPVIVIFVALAYILGARAAKRRRQTLIERLGPSQFVDVDIFTDGIRTSSGVLTITLDWKGVQDIVVSKDRVEFDGDAFACYIPQRAFKSRAEFEEGIKQAHQLWAKAKDRPPEAVGS
jgi:hypothetical protein